MSGHLPTYRRAVERPFTGIVVLVVAVILLDCVRTIHDALPDATAPQPQAMGGCFYQILEDDIVVASSLSAQPEVLSEILTAAGMKDKFKWADGSLRMPCDRAIKFNSTFRAFSAERIPAALLVAASRRIDINQADETDLRAIPGIGPRTAEKILRHREQEGAFSCLEDLRRIPGIGKKKLATLAPYVEIGNREATYGSPDGEGP